jgi:nucleoporin GLE1
LLSSWNNSLQPLVSNEALKPFVFACQKAVNVPVNAVGSVSSSHLKDKLDKLEALLSGQPVEVVGKSTKFSATEHQLGIAFCKNLLAKKLVDQGADVVSSKPEQAFSMAFVVVALWNKFPDFGTLFLAHLYKTCPYLLPCHFVRAPSMTDAEYYKLLGYKHDGDGVEEQTMFIKRMSGLARLYAAIAVSTLPKAKADEDHPHGLGNIWRWMAAVMNTTPINDVTATLLSEVLEITGYAMLNSYGIHFRKLLVAIQRDFIPAIRSVTLEGSGGPVQRLQLFLEKFAQSGIIKKASGMLAPGFL